MGRGTGFGVSRSRVGMALLALIDCLFEMFDRFFGMRISLRLLTGLRVGQRGLSVSGEDIGMSHLAMVNGLLGVRYGFGDMIFRSQRNLRYQKQSEAETQHGDDESTGHERILRLIYCFSTNSPFFTVGSTIVNPSRRRRLHWQRGLGAAVARRVARKGRLGRHY